MIYRIKNNVFLMNLIKLSIIIIPLILLIYIYNHLTPLYADDYTYSFAFGPDRKALQSVFDIIPSMYNHYFTMNGRLFVHTLAQLFLYIGKPVFNIINTFSFVFFGLLIYYHSFLSFKKVRVLPLIFIYFALFFVTPDFGQSYLWMTGASNYLYGPIITLLYLIPFRRSISSLKMLSVPKSILYSSVMLLLGLIAGNSNENNGVTVVFISVVFIVYCIIKYKSVRVWSVFGLIGSIAGCLLMLLSPGTKERLGESGLGLTQLPKRIILNTFTLLEVFALLFIILAILICVFVFKRKQEGKCSIKTILIELKITILYFVTFLLSFYSLSVAPSFPLRTWSTFIVFLIISICTMYNTTLQLFEKKDLLLTKRVLAICLLTITIGTYANNYFQLKVIKLSYNERVSIITESIANNNKTVYLPSIKSNSRFSCFDNDGDIKNDCDYWENLGLAKYYGLERIYLKQE